MTLIRMTPMRKLILEQLDALDKLAAAMHGDETAMDDAHFNAVCAQIRAVRTSLGVEADLWDAAETG